MVILPRGKDLWLNNQKLFLPMGPVTGIGSLPMADPYVAVEFIAETCLEIPFWPVLAIWIIRSEN
jgi:hypothetical protein